MRYTLKFIRYGGEEVLDFECGVDARMMYQWFADSSASTNERLYRNDRLIASKEDEPKKAVRRTPKVMSGKFDSPSQKSGAAAALPNAGTNAAIVYEALKTFGSKGATFFDLSEVTGMNYNNVGPRVRGLRLKGLVEMIGTRPGPKGTIRDVYRVRDL